MSNLIEDWDTDAWNKVDPKITTLRHKVDNLSALVNTISSDSSLATSDIQQLQLDLSDVNKRLDTISITNKLLFLLGTEDINKDQMINLIKMLKSVDTENYVVAMTTITNLISKYE